MIYLILLFCFCFVIFFCLLLIIRGVEIQVLKSSLESGDLSSNALILAQKEADKSFKYHVFPRYKEDGSFGTASCNAAHDVLAVISYPFSALAWSIGKLSSAAFKGMDWTLGWAFRPMIDYVYPINPMNGSRHFPMMSRSWEKFLSDKYFHPMNTAHLNTTSEILPNSKKKISTVVKEVASILIERNKEFLNPKGMTPFSYSTQTVIGEEISSSARFGGKILISSQMIKEIANEIDAGEIKTAKVRFQDGSIATVNLEGLKKEDVIAAIVSREMANIAARRSTSLAFAGIFGSLFNSIRRSMLVSAHDQQGHPTDKKQNLRGLIGYPENPRGVTQLESNQFALSRKKELEADVAGAFLANQAGFDPRGMLYLQEFLLSKKSSDVQKMMELTENFNAEPHGSKRLRAVLTALSTITPESLKDKVTWAPSKYSYDLKHASEGVLIAEKVKKSTST